MVENEPPVLMESDFLQFFNQLCADTDRQVDDTDGHARWEFYRSLIPDDSRRPALLKCLSHEPDASMATSILATLLEATDPSQRSEVLRAAPESGERFLSQRSEELGLLETFADGPSGEDRATARSEEIERLIGGSDWLQRRVTERSASIDALEELARRGRTRKVRARAGERLASIRHAS